MDAGTDGVEEASTSYIAGDAASGRKPGVGLEAPPFSLPGPPLLSLPSVSQADPFFAQLRRAQRATLWVTGSRAPHAKPSKGERG